eukprot:CAMPEP_0117421318 /NCGR_PEP_ID=MMETSP0758-20121206/2447_1 /TAXON_ID=63605 /ORGANISM="Percolomonas cosmopolitus, Strain AE-1 (ATCC 50343)" /LENGTH=250 /DNA_ID=CAMNT_0005203397 /DNA_START=336 /DNA_END=1088 /DNA_ORIENTATION=+
MDHILDAIPRDEIEVDEKVIYIENVIYYILAYIHESDLLSLLDHLSDDTLIRTLSEVFECRELDKPDHTRLVQATLEEMMIDGLIMILSNLSVPTLKNIAKVYSIPPSNKNRRELSFNILSLAFPHLTVDPEERIEHEWMEDTFERPALVHGITYDQIFQNYRRKELVRYFKHRNIKFSSSWKHRVVIQKLLNHLEEEHLQKEEDNRTKRKRDQQAVDLSIDTSPMKDNRPQKKKKTIERRGKEINKLLT